MFLAALIVVVVLWAALRKPKLVPGKFQAAIEALVGFVRDEIAVGIIGPEGVKYFPYLLSIFMFILVGNLFEVTPAINFPITSRMAIPAFLALCTYFIYLVTGFARHKFTYLKEIVWPSVPIALRPSWASSSCPVLRDHAFSWRSDSSPTWWRATHQPAPRHRHHLHRPPSAARFRSSRAEPILWFAMGLLISSTLVSVSGLHLPLLSAVYIEDAVRELY